VKGKRRKKTAASLQAPGLEVYSEEHDTALTYIAPTKKRERETFKIPPQKLK
jgi:hypothetical protein